jgi:hypothetical protein
VHVEDPVDEERAATRAVRLELERERQLLPDPVRGGDALAQRRAGEPLDERADVLDSGFVGTNRLVVWGTETVDQFLLRRDLVALLSLPFFDKTKTRVTTETGPRGGVIVIFNIAELPVIRDITFEGLKSVTADELKRALRARRTGIHQEAPYDPARVAAAKRVVRELLAARGFEGAEVEVRVDELSALSVTLRFIIKEGRGGRWF